jgi:hypothetical protein
MARTQKRNLKNFLMPDSELNELPPHLAELNESRAMTLDLESLKSELIDLAHAIEPIAIPSKQAWEGMLFERSLNVPFKNERLYWAYHAYYGSERFRAAVDDYNTVVRFSGLVELAQGKAPAENSAASNVLRAIEDKRPSSALLDAWFHFGVLLGRQSELLEAHTDQKGLFQRGLKSGASSTSIGQQVWYARWLEFHWLNEGEDRATVESELAEMCNDVVRMRRKVHRHGEHQSPWEPDWFTKLFEGGRRPAPLEIPELADRLTRMTRTQIERLSRHAFIPSKLLPPLRAIEFPRVGSSHP